MDWLQGFIIWDSLNRQDREKSMPPTITKKDWKGYDEKTKERFRAVGIDLDDQLETIAKEHRNTPTHGVTVTSGVVYPREKRKREGDVTSYVAGTIVLGIGFVIHAIGTLIVTLGSWIIKQGAYMRNR